MVVAGVKAQEDIIKMHFSSVEVQISQVESMVGFCEHGTKPSDFIKVRGEFFNLLNRPVNVSRKTCSVE